MHTVNPDAEVEKVEKSLSFDWVPTYVRISTCDEFRVALLAAA